MNGIPAETAHTEAGAPAEQPTPAKKPRSAAQKAHVAVSRARSGKKATPAKKSNKGAKSAKSSKKKASGARQGSKAAKVLDHLKRSDGCLPEGTHESHRLGKKMGLAVTSTKAEDGERRYSLCGAPHNA